MQLSRDHITSGIRHSSQRVWAWITRDAHKQKAQALRQDVEKLFTEHPQASGETYIQHLAFTLGMSARILFCSIALLVHGIFPFMFKRTTSRQMMSIYRIIQSRLPDKPTDLDAGF